MCLAPSCPVPTFPSGIGQKVEPTLQERVRQRKGAWRVAGANAEVLQWVSRGVKINWTRGPPATFDHGVSLQDLAATQHTWLEKQAKRHVDNGARDGYHCVGIHPDFQKYMQFDVQGELYQCSALPFGWNDSPKKFHQVHEDSGGGVTVTGSDQGPSGSVEIAYDNDAATMGMDFKEGVFRVTHARLKKITSKATDLLCEASRERRWVPARKLAAFNRLCQSVYLAVPVARLHLRELFFVLAKKRSWGAKVKLTRQSFGNLEWWKRLPSSQQVEQAEDLESQPRLDEAALRERWWGITVQDGDAEEKLRRLAEHNDWYFSFDLQDGYHYVGIDPEFQKFMQFDVQGELYPCSALPFGWNDSPSDDGTRQKAGPRGARVLPYMDIFLLLASSEKEAYELRARGQAVCARAALRAITRQAWGDLEWWKGLPAQCKWNGRKIWRCPARAKLHTDASLMAWVGVLNLKQEARGFWDDNLWRVHIMRLELEAVYKAVQTFLRELTGKVVRRYCDN
eukprot:gene16054-biopygen16552